MTCNWCDSKVNEQFIIRCLVCNSEFCSEICAKQHVNFWSISKESGELYSGYEVIIR